ncbi:MAG: GTPase ObgE [Candidatus Dormibacteria bacterium]
MFLDDVRIRVRSGAGGPGAMTFRREKFVPSGGPDGGDGGHGADIILVASAGLNSLSHFKGRRLVSGQRGRPGRSALKHGSDAEAVRLLVPVGTVAIDDESGQLIGELTEDGAELVVARGGRGGRGNARFSNSRRQAPRFAELGEPSRELGLQLELRLIADVGLVGAPNAGKSTLLGALTAATPRIADYPFTTLEPNLGVLELTDGDRLVLADVPGLIEGASEGVGLGTAFLKHLSRTSILVHLVDASAGVAEARAAFEAVQDELAGFDADLPGRVRVVALNKVDVVGSSSAAKLLTTQLATPGREIVTVSAREREGLAELVEAVARVHAAARGPHRPPLRVYRPEPQFGPLEVAVEGDVFTVTGVEVERIVTQTDMSNPDALERMQQLLGAAGLRQALVAAGAGEGDTVRLGDQEFLFNPEL